MNMEEVTVPIEEKARGLAVLAVQLKGPRDASKFHRAQSCLTRALFAIRSKALLEYLQGRGNYSVERIVGTRRAIQRFRSPGTRAPWRGLRGKGRTPVG